MRMLRTFAAVIAAALAAMLATAVTLVWEGGRWIARSLRRSLAPPHQEQVAEAVLDAEVDTGDAEQAARAAATRERREVNGYGYAALSYLAGDDADREEARAVLGEDAWEFLDRLTLEEATRLYRHAPHLVAAHLRGQRVLPGVPRPETADERALRLHGEAQAQAEVNAILDELAEEAAQQAADDVALPRAA